MKCPHCTSNITYRERPKRCCAKCRKEIALEPREDPLGLSDLRLRALAAKLSTQGKIHYTPAQLFHFAGRKTVEAQYQQKILRFGCWIPLLLVGIIGLGIVTEAPFVYWLGVVAIIALGIYFRQWLYLPEPPQVTLPDQLAQFQQKIPERWQKVYGELPMGWGILPSTAKRAKQPPGIAEVQALVGSPVPDVLACLRLNGVDNALGLGLITLGDKPVAPDEEALLNWVRQRPQIPVLLLHDATIDGCLFVHSVQQRLRLSDRHRIINLGLHPRQAMRDNLLRLRSRTDAAKLARLKTLVNPATGQGNQPAPFGQLTPAEYEWLAQGYYTPLLAITPQRLLKTVTRGVLAATQPTVAQPQLGFMDWPQPQEST